MTRRDRVACRRATVRWVNDPAVSPKGGRGATGKKDATDGAGDGWLWRWRHLTFGPASEEPYRRRTSDWIRLVVALSIVGFTIAHEGHPGQFEAEPVRAAQRAPERPPRLLQGALQPRDALGRRARRRRGGRCPTVAPRARHGDRGSRRMVHRPAPRQPRRRGRRVSRRASTSSHDSGTGPRRSRWCASPSSSPSS